MTSERTSTARRAALVMLWCALAGGCVLLWPARRELPAHADITYPETTVAYNAQTAAQTGRVYLPISQPPYTPSVYGPVYYLGLAGIARAGALNLDRLLIAGRALSLLAFALVIAGAWWLALGLRAPPLFAALAAALVFADPEFLRTNVSARPDLLALALCICAIVLAVRDTTTWRRFAVVGFLASCAVLVKAPYVAAPMAVVAWLALSRRWKALAAFVGGALLPAIACGLWLRAHGDPLLGEAGLLESGLNDPMGAVRLVAREIFHYWPHVLILAGAAVFSRRALRLDPRAPQFLVALYWILSWIVAALTLVNSGGNVNYLLEPWVASSVLFATALAAMPRLDPSREWAVPAVCAIAAIAGTIHDVRLARSAAVPDYSALASVSEHSRVLSDVSYLSARSQQPELLDPFLSGQLAHAGRWDDRPVIDDLQQDRFDFVVLTAYHERLREYRRNPFVSPRMLVEIVANYAPFCETAGQGPQRAERLLVLLPKRDPDTALAAELKNTGCQPTPNPSLVHEMTAVAGQTVPARVAKR